MLAVLLLAAGLAGSPVQIARDGRALLPIVAGSQDAPVQRLRSVLSQMSGASFEVVRGDTAAGIHVGLVSDFPKLAIPDAPGLGPEGFILRSDGPRVLMVAAEPAGVEHAVSTFLHRLGCRWFFPGSTWAVIPRRRTIEGSWNERSVPDFGLQRRLWYGYGASRAAARELREWEVANRMGGSVRVEIKHTWHGLQQQKDFEAHPEWFALTGGRRQWTKPCYSHPAVLERAVEHALRQAGNGKAMVSMSPPDGLGYCECPRCLAVLEGAPPRRDREALFGRRPDGVVVGVATETLFRFVNGVAKALADRYPRALVGCYAYSGYAHPPSFDLHPNVFVQVTTAYRRTSLGLDEQLAAWSRRARHVGAREYYSVYQWDWDNPFPGRVRPASLQRSLRRLHHGGVRSLNAEASNNWGPRGLGYYVAAQLMWDVDADVSRLLEDFYRSAFGPAASPMKRYYERWYGPPSAESDPDVVGRDEADNRHTVSRDDLRAAFGDLDAAAHLARNDPGPRERVDALRAYAHYLLLRLEVEEAAAQDEAAVLRAIEGETRFGMRLADTGMIHTRALSEAFSRRFARWQSLLEKRPDTQAWRKPGAALGSEELGRLWAGDLARLAERAR